MLLYKTEAMCYNPCDQCDYKFYNIYSNKTCSIFESIHSDFHTFFNELDLFFKMRCIIDLMTNKLMNISKFGWDNYGDHTHFSEVSHGFRL